MKRWWHNTIGPIGLDIGERSVKAAQVVHGASGPRLAQAVVLPRDPAPADGAAAPFRPLSAAEARRLREALNRRGFAGRDAVLSLPTQAALMSVLELPPAESGAPLATIARQELAHAHRRGEHEIEAAFWELPRPARPTEGTPVMAAGCAHADAEAIVAPVEAAGLAVAGLDVEGWAIARACRPLSTSGDEIVAIVDLGWASGTLVLLYGGTVVYERGIAAAGLRPLHDAVRQACGLEPEAVEYALRDVGFEADERARSDDWRILVKARSHLEAHFEVVAREVTLAMRYAQNQYPRAAAERVLLTGGGACVPGAAGHLGTATGLNVTTLTPADALGAGGDASDEAACPALLIATGLALWDEKEAARCAA